MSKETDKRIIVDEAPDSHRNTETASETMDVEEAAIVAKVLARLMVDAETKNSPSQDSVHHFYSEEELLAAEAAEQAAKKTFFGHIRSAFKRLLSVMTPDNKKYSVPAIIAELMVLAALIVVLGRYSHVAPETPTQYSDPGKDTFSCQDGTLCINDISVSVPTGENVDYSISYSWAEDDTDYPSVPHAIVASYRDAADGRTMYDISLYRDSFTSKKETRKYKNARNWFSKWKTERTDEIHKFRHKVGKIRGFCVSSLDAKSPKSDSRTCTYYFAVTESNGISLYILEGVCYDTARSEDFNKIMMDSIDSIKVKQ